MHKAWLIAVQPIDKIMVPMNASKAKNSLFELAKIASKESNHHDIALQSKIDQGHD